jgi:transcriptional regulator with XRE-family HTH domain
MSAGEQLKDLRNKLGISTRDVEEYSRKIAEIESNEDFYISNSYLTQIENTESVPSIRKLFTISAIYHTNYNELLELFGVRLGEMAKCQQLIPLNNTHLTKLLTSDAIESVTFPIRFDPGCSIDKTNLLSRMIEVWGEVPVPLLQGLNLRHNLYGYIGLKDFSLYPLLRPGSFVQIDDTLDNVREGPWRSELERPIYFIELRDGYACSWCELHGHTLTLVPHPLAPCSVRQFAYPDEAEIVGQVTAAAMRLISPSSDSSRATPRLTRQS